MNLTEDFWNNRYLNNDIGWDLGVVSPPLKTYFDQLTNKNLKILIPGGGNSYEAEYLFKKGFRNVYVVDVSESAIKNIKNRVPQFPEGQLIHSDFFDLEMDFDLIIEQTFFCAIPPTLRKDYALKVKELLNEKGKLVGVLFSVPLNTDKPPFGGSKDEYLKYFQPFFNVEIFEACYNSIQSRASTELFVKLQLK
ncbi:methyltransferase domain-containing protein [Thalassobellus citreus]|uniref:methyltransferase domain-containing protein n=1 Tax=Thalassobellus citreus TaxID=3367752 RepID=UPI0037B703AF